MKNEIMEYLEERKDLLIDEIEVLKDDLTDVINNSEAKNISLRRKEVLNEKYLEIEEKIHIINKEIERIEKLMR